MQFSKIKPISRSSIQAVRAEVKRQLSIYNAYQEDAVRKQLRVSKPMFCGNGLVSYDVTTMKFEHVTTTEGTISAGVSASKIPVGTAATLDIGASQSRTTSDSQTLTFTDDVQRSPAYVGYYGGSMDDSPIANVLATMAETAIDGANQPTNICFKSRAGDGNSYKIAITVTDDGKGNIGVGLAPAALTASGELKSTTGNTITVSFGPHDFTKPFGRRPPAPGPRDCAGAGTHMETSLMSTDTCHGKGGNRKATK
ncbi:hypothetical protein NKH52_28430 [Mesorhizobium sp. M1066]|uniref:hypothetical protein n=1 Tax=unclassified Mesorhizobium TaxID=325217 RepID=UPI00333D4F2A